MKLFYLTFSILIYPAYLDKGKNKSISPELVINNNTPPFFIFGTSDDRFAHGFRVIAAALRGKRIPVELHILQKGGTDMDFELVI